MAHSNRKNIEIAYIFAEFALFAGAIATAFFSPKGYWGWFSGVSALPCIVFIGVKVAQAFPKFKEIRVHEPQIGIASRRDRE